jgi:hypothetical protein
LAQFLCGGNWKGQCVILPHSPNNPFSLVCLKELSELSYIQVVVLCTDALCGDHIITEYDTPTAENTYMRTEHDKNFRKFYRRSFKTTLRKQEETTLTDQTHMQEKILHSVNAYYQPVRSLVFPPTV